MEFSKDTLTLNLNRYQIPVYMHAGIIRWVQEGVKPGDFLTAIIENDLKEAIARADENNIIRLIAYVNFFYNAAPIGCWGSKDKVNEWAKMGGLRKVQAITQTMIEEFDGE